MCSTAIWGSDTVTVLFCCVCFFVPFTRQLYLNKMFLNTAWFAPFLQFFIFISFFPLLVRMWMLTRGPQPRTWLVSGTCCSSPSRTSVSSSMSSTISNPMTGSLCRLRLPSRSLTGRYFPPLLPSALAGVGKPPKPASLLPPPPPFLPLFFLTPFQVNPILAWDRQRASLSCSKGPRRPL